MTEASCDQLRDLAPELALGTLDGRARADALAHVTRCPACREELRRHTEVLDELLGTVPSLEPPAGFESRTLERIARERTAAAPGRRRRRRATAAAVAAAVAVAVGVAGYEVGAHRDRSPELRQGTLVSAGHPVGTAYLYGGTYPFVYMGVSVGSGESRLTCELEAGRRVVATVGTFSLTRGAGWWGAPVPVRGAPITGARLVDAAGATVAEATFSR